MKIAILINATIRKYKKIVAEVDAEFKDCAAKIFISQYAGHFMQLCKEALDLGYDCFIFVGGDGSLNEGINGVIKYHQLNESTDINGYDWHAISKIKIGVYAAGSGNDYIKSLQLDEKLSTLKHHINSQSSRMVDVGWMSYHNFAAQQDVSFFINVTDVGMGGEVVQKKSKMPKWLSGKLTYFIAITATIASYKKCQLKAYNQDFSWDGKVLNMIVANARYFGNSLGIAPDADVADGMFSLVIVGDVSLFDYLKNLGNLKKCKKLIHPQISYHRVNEISIEATDGRSVTIDMDGEFIGSAPMQLKCLSQKINFIC